MRDAGDLVAGLADGGATRARLEYEFPKPGATAPAPALALVAV